MAISDRHGWTRAPAGTALARSTILTSGSGSARCAAVPATRWAVRSARPRHAATATRSSPSSGTAARFTALRAAEPSTTGSSAPLPASGATPNAGALRGARGSPCSTSPRGTAGCAPSASVRSTGGSEATDTSSPPLTTSSLCRRAASTAWPTRSWPTGRATRRSGTPRTSSRCPFPPRECPRGRCADGRKGSSAQAEQSASPHQQ